MKARIIKLWPYLALSIVLLLGLIKLSLVLRTPKVTAFFPNNQASDVRLDQTIELEFDRPMVKTAITSDNISLDPELKGTWTWANERSLKFTPLEKMPKATLVTVHLKHLTSTWRMPLNQYSSTFETLGTLKVVNANPQSEIGVGRSPITVVFSQPVVSLSSITQEQKHLPGFSIEPGIKGIGRWLGSFTYQFTPDQAWPIGQKYTYTLNPDLTTLDGVKLSGKQIYSFYTPLPKVIRTIPQANYGYASLTASVSAVMTMPIDLNKSVDKFKLYELDGSQETEVPATISKNGQYLGLYPKQKLKPSTKYVAKVLAGITALGANQGSNEDYFWEFTTISHPQVFGHLIDSDISISFASPMNEESIKKNLTISPSLKSKPAGWFSTYGGNEFTLSNHLEPLTDYTITIGPNTQDIHGTTLGKPYTFTFQTPAAKPRLTILGDKIIGFSAYGTPKIITETVNTPKVDYDIYRLTPTAFLKLTQKYHASPDDSNLRLIDTTQSGFEKVNTWQETNPTNPKSEKWFRSVHDLKGLSEGFYYLRANGGKDNIDSKLIIITKSSLVLKYSNSTKQMLVWAVDLGSGKPLEGKELYLVDESAPNTKIVSGKTNKDGVWLIKLDGETEFNRNKWLISDKGSAAVNSSWTNGISIYDFNMASDTYDYQSDQDLRGFLHLDRPIYRPGETINFKGTVRQDNNAAYSLPSKDLAVVVNLMHDGNIVQTLNTRLDVHGGFWGNMHIPESIQLGSSVLTAEIGKNQFSQELMVEEFVTPEFDVVTSTNKDQYAHQDIVNANVSAKYYFGANLKNAKVSWTLTGFDKPYRYSKDSQYSFGDTDDYWFIPWWSYDRAGNYGEQWQTGLGKTDTKGQFNLNLPIDISKKTSTQQMRLEFEVFDDQGKTIANSKQFMVHKSGIELGIKSNQYYGAPGNPISLDIIALDLNENIVPSLPVTMTVYKRNWHSVKEKNPEDDTFYWISKPEDVLIESRQIALDALGQSNQAVVLPEGGSYKIAVTAIDSLGRQAKSVYSVWAYDEATVYGRENNSRINLIPNKQDYMLGDQAKFMASLDGSGYTGLVTSERHEVFDYKLINSGEFTVDTTTKHVPNVFVSAIFVKPSTDANKPPQLKMGVTEIRVTNPDQVIRVEVQTDKTTYLHGDTVKGKIVTKNYNNQPLSAQVSFAMSDMAIWNLSGSGLSDIFASFYNLRNLQVTTAADLTVSADYLAVTTDLGSKGGAGKGGDGNFLTIRDNFVATAFWKADITTNNNGEWEFSIPLPDNLTTWRMVAFASDDATRVGQAEQRIVVTKSLIIRPDLPRFLVVGDKLEIGATAHNNTDGQLQTSVSIDAPNLKLDVEKTQTIIIPAKSTAQVRWPSLVLPSVDKESFVTMTTQAGNLSDAVKIALPIQTRYTFQSTAVSGSTQSDASEKINVSEDIVFGMGNLKINLASSLAKQITSINTYLDTYAYDCAEQSSSRLVNNLIKLKQGKDPKILNLAQNEITRLANLQLTDGGWSWWPGKYDFEVSNSLSTAQILQALLYAKSIQGITVDEETITQASTYLRNNFFTATLDTKAFIAYVLANSSSLNQSDVSGLIVNRHKLTLTSRGYLLQALQTAKLNPSGIRGTLAGELESLSSRSSEYKYWHEPNIENYMWQSDILATAIISQGLYLERRDSRELDKSLIWLLRSSKEGYWLNTRNTAEVLRIATDIYLAEKSDAKNTTWKVLLNNQPQFSGTDVNYQGLIPLTSLTKGKDNLLDFRVSGNNRLHYLARMNYYLPHTKSDPIERGFGITREFLNDQGQPLNLNKLPVEQEITVKLTVSTALLQRNVLIEDFVPAGFEPINTNLATSAHVDLKSDLYDAYTEIRKDRVVVSTPNLYPGVYEYNYKVRTTLPGKYVLSPAKVSDMYAPDIFGQSSGGWVEISK